MSWLAIVIVIIGIYLALKVVGFLFKFAMILLVLFALYWLAAPYLGMPPPF
ncbi:MAG: hypothetical protein WC213_00330 [Arenimonas sp.]|jgi:hypothetical protein